MKLETVFTVSVKNGIGILLGSALNLKIVLSKTAIFKIFVLPTHDHQWSKSMIWSGLALS